MGSSKKQTVGYYYYKDLAGVLCHGPVDAITRIECSDRQIMRGSIENSGPTTILAENVFGGKDREGGVSGIMDIMFGDDEQLPNTYMKSKISTAVNAMRGVVAVVWNQLYVGMNPYMRDFKYRVRRTSTGWYQDKSIITTYEQDNKVVSDFSIDVLTKKTGLPDLSTNIQYSEESGDFYPKIESFSYSIESTTTDDDYHFEGSISFKNNSENDILIKVTSQSSGISSSPEIDETILVKSGSEFDMGSWFTGLIPKDVGTGYSGSTALSVEFLEANYSFLDFDINPAHIIRDVLTNKRYGLGVPEIKIDDAAFTKIADTLYEEKLGMSILWDGSGAIEDFLNTICTHICATMPYVDSESGLWTCKLLRDDYDVNTLISLNEYNVIKCSEFARKTMVDLINTVTVNYWDRETGDTGTVTVDNTARIAQQGKVIAQQVDYKGFTNGEVASRVALRDLKTLSTPLASATLDVKEIVGGLKVGDCFKWSWNDYGLNNAIMRVSSIKRSGVLANYVTIECIEDSYSMPMQSVLPYVPPPVGNFEDAKPVDGILIESTYFELVQRYGQTFVDQQLTAENESGYVLAVAATDQNAINADMNISSGGDFEDVGIVDLLPPCLITQEINQVNSSFNVSNASTFNSITAGSYFKINNELMRFDSILSDVVSVGRGVLDTIPENHAINSKIFMIDEYSSIDETLYFEGQTIAGKLLTNTGSDVLELAEAPTITTTMNSRAFRPYPPANVKINDSYWPVDIDTDLILTWSDRNRLQQTSGNILDWFDASVTIEPNTQTYLTISQLDEDDVELATTNVNVTGATSYTMPIESMQPSCKFVKLNMKTTRDGFDCLFEFNHTVELSQAFSEPYNLKGVYKND